MGRPMTLQRETDEPATQPAAQSKSQKLNAVHDDDESAALLHLMEEIHGAPNLTSLLHLAASQLDEIGRALRGKG
jgi:hypothetical protein